MCALREGIGVVQLPETAPPHVSFTRTRGKLSMHICADEIIGKIRLKKTLKLMTMMTSTANRVRVAMATCAPRPIAYASLWQREASDVTAPTAHSPLRLCNLSVAQLLITMALAPSASLWRAVVASPSACWQRYQCRLVSSYSAAKPASQDQIKYSNVIIFLW